MRKSIAILALSFLFCVTPVLASTLSTVKDNVKESLFSELASWLATIPGIGYLENKVDSNQYRIISSIQNKGILTIDTSVESSTTVFFGSTRYGIQVFDKAELPAIDYKLLVVQKDAPNLDRFIERQVSVKVDHIHHESVVFWEKGTKSFPIEIKTYPEAKRIRIMNITAKYYPGILLRAGKYDIEVLFTGEQNPRRFYVTLDRNQQTFHIYQ